MPERAIFIGSTLKPELQDRIVSWSLLALPIGDVQTIDLKAWLEDNISGGHKQGQGICYIPESDTNCRGGVRSIQDYPNRRGKERNGGRIYNRRLESTFLHRP